MDCSIAGSVIDRTTSRSVFRTNRCGCAGRAQAGERSRGDFDFVRKLRYEARSKAGQRTRLLNEADSILRKSNVTKKDSSKVESLLALADRPDTKTSPSRRRFKKF